MPRPVFHPDPARAGGVVLLLPGGAMISGSIEVDDVREVGEGVVQLEATFTADDPATAALRLGSSSGTTFTVSSEP